MSTPLDAVKAQIARDFKETGRLDPAPWVVQYPEWATEISSFIDAFASVAPAQSEPWNDAGGNLRRIQHNIMRIAAIRKADEGETDLGFEIGALSGPTVMKPRHATWNETKAAVM